jgi:hypothetical protein
VYRLRREILETRFGAERRSAGLFLSSVLLLLLASVGASAQSQSPNLEDSLKHYQSVFPLPDPYTKLVDNAGKGPADLQGLRNFRAVLSGLVYRGGKLNPEGNRYPLTSGALNNLCRAGFDQAVYLYASNMNQKILQQSCGISPAESSITYYRSPPIGSASNVRMILELIHEKIIGSDHKPIYLHCWNGWHASGYISALVLRQFCDVPSEQAVAYWNYNTDHVCKGATYDQVREAIGTFKPYPDLKIVDELKPLLCPQLSIQVDEKTWCK